MGSKPCIYVTPSEHTSQCAHWISSVHTGYPVSTYRGFLQYCSTAKKYCSTALPSTADCRTTTNLLLLFSTRVQHVSQKPLGRAKCPADPHTRRRPKREAEGREPDTAGHGDRGTIWRALLSHRRGHNES
jgi:hypothetical protein